MATKPRVFQVPILHFDKGHPFGNAIIEPDTTPISLNDYSGYRVPLIAGKPPGTYILLVGSQKFSDKAVFHPSIRQMGKLYFIREDHQGEEITCTCHDQLFYHIGDSLTIINPLTDKPYNELNELMNILSNTRDLEGLWMDLVPMPSKHRFNQFLVSTKATIKRIYRNAIFAD